MRDEGILQVATQVFAAKGFRNTDVQEIADLLRIGKGTIYRAFGTKEELFFATVDHGMRKLSEQLAGTACRTLGHRRALEDGSLPFSSVLKAIPN